MLCIDKFFIFVYTFTPAAPSTLQPEYSMAKGQDFKKVGADHDRARGLGHKHRTGERGKERQNWHDKLRNTGNKSQR